MNGIPKVSVIIPSLDGHREGNVPRLLDDLKKQTFRDFEVIVSKGISPNGRARNEGVKKAKGEIFVFIDDDVVIGTDKLIENLIRPFGEDSTIGVTGASQLITEDSNAFQRRVAREFPRVYFPVVDKITETDMVSHMCLCVPRKVYEEVGGESDFLPGGTDPDFKARIRKAGYKVVVVPHTWAYHPAAKNLSVLLKRSFQAGKDSAWVAKYHPDLVYESSRHGLDKTFVGKRPLIYRVFRGSYLVFESILRFRFLFLVSRVVYMCGYLNGWFAK